MPRKKQGQAIKVEQHRETSGAEVKKKTSSGVETICNELTGKTSTSEGSVCEVKAVSSTLTTHFIQNGTFSSSNVAVREESNDTESTAEFVANSSNISDYQEFKTCDSESRNCENAERIFSMSFQREGSAENSNVIRHCNGGLSSDGELHYTVQNAEGPANNALKNSVIKMCHVKTFSDADMDLQESEPSGTQCSGTSSTEKYMNQCSDQSTEFSQNNYYNSTIVTHTKPYATSSSSDTELKFCSASDQHELLSSVYGTSASRIEKVLPGLCLEQSKEIPNSFTLALKATYSSQGASCDKSVPVKSSSPEVTKSGVRACPLSPSNKNKEKKLETNGCLLKNNTISMPNFNSLPKLHIPDSLSSDDSDSLQQAPESQKISKFPKITSPQILEQHITKIISQNAAIVETLDPLWSKRYLRQSSQNSDADNVGKKSGSKARSFSSEKFMPVLNIEGGPSKLQSALLGTLEPDTHIAPFLFHKSEKSVIASVGYNASSGCVPVSKHLNRPMEDELKGSAIKNLLCLKQGQYFSKKNTVCKDMYNQHPQNPEGSIIKDLLLKSKSQAHCTEPDMETCRKPLSFNFLTSAKCAEKAYSCTGCGSKYFEERLLVMHKMSCIGSSKISASAGSEGKLINVKDIFIGTKMSAVDNMPFLNSLVLSNNVEDLLMKDSPNTKTADECVGHILKSQLLSAASLQTSPPLKKRKISEPILSQQLEDEASCSTQLPQSSEGARSSLQRCRSHSVHLFGGEVHIHDGAKMKRLKIGGDLSKPVSSKIVSNSSTNHFVVDPKCSLNGDAAYPNVVTIAQPVHNSGGTVTQVPDDSSPPQCQIAVTLSNTTLTDKRNTERRCDGVPVIQRVKSPLVTSFVNVAAQFTANGIEKGGPRLSPKVLPPSNTCSSSRVLQNLGISSSSTYKQNLGSPSLGSEIVLFQEKQKLDTPTIMFTPSSPTYSSSDKGTSNKEESCSTKFLAPTRPTSLPLKKKPFTMVGSTLVSPDTPRPKKSCVQLYINGQAYTYLGLKCSTRSTYCCIYRPQPMFVLQETDSKLSMYSNWQVVAAKEELFGMTPGQMLSFYNSRQPSCKSTTTTAKIGESLSFTHSSYWTFRSQKKVVSECEGQGIKDQSDKSPKDATDPAECFEDSSEKPVGSEPSTSFGESPTKLPSRKKIDSLSDEACFDADPSISDTEVNNSHDDDEDDDDKTEVNTDSSQSQPPKRVKIFEGGFKSNEDYTYVRGRGRGKYVCEECGIRCKKPSMLKKHIRTHTDLRPYKCRHCSFAFKTKGNLTKHMKSKAHHKKCTELGISPVPFTPDDSQTDEDTFTKQDHFQRKNFSFSDEEIDDEGDDEDPDDELDDSDGVEEEYESDSSSMAAKNVSLTNGQLVDSNSRENTINDMDASSTNQDSSSQCSVEQEAARSLLHLSSFTQPSQWSSAAEFSGDPPTLEMMPISSAEKSETFCAVSPTSTSVLTTTATTVKRSADQQFLMNEEPIGHRPRSYSADIPFGGGREHFTRHQTIQSSKACVSNEVKETADCSSSVRRYSISVAREARKPCIVQSPLWTNNVQKIHHAEAEQPMDLRIPRGQTISQGKCFITSLSKAGLQTLSPTEEALNSEMYAADPYSCKKLPVLSPQLQCDYDTSAEGSNNSFNIAALQERAQLVVNSGYLHSQQFYSSEGVEGSFVCRAGGSIVDGRQSPEISDLSVCSPVSPASADEALLSQESSGIGQAHLSDQDANKSLSELMAPSTSSNMEEGKCICRICNKIFAKAGQLRIHVNIHYFERPFRCDNCGVSFRTKGHLQKHKRSVSHYNKVNMNMTFGTPTVDNPRPFKCADCKIAFRIHGHLAKHLRSKMHIMKLECLGKLPFGMYAEMERSGISLNEIDTTDCANSLESLQVMAQKLYQRDPRRMRWHSANNVSDAEAEAVQTTQASSVLDAVPSVPDQHSVPLSSPSAIAVPVPSITSANPAKSDLKNELSDSASFQGKSPMVKTEARKASASHFTSDQSASVSQRVTRPAEGKESESTASLHRSDTCPICGRMFKSAKFLQVHLYCDHPNWNKPPEEVPIKNTANNPPPRQTVIAQEFACDICGKHFQKQNCLKQHLLTHAQLRPFVCEVCDAGFTSSASLVSHLATHKSSDRTSE